MFGGIDTRARNLMAERRFLEALALWRELGEHWPQHAEGCLGESDTLEALGRPMEALRTLSQGAERFPTDPRPAIGYASLALRQSMGGLALARFERAQEQFPNESEAFLGFAEALESAGDVERALSSLEAVAERFIDNPRTELLLGRLYLRRGDPVTAFARFESATSRRDADCNIYLAAADALTRHGRFTEADQILAKCVERYPDDLSARIAYSRTAEVRKDWPEALCRWKAVRLAFPDALEGYRGIGNALQAAGRMGRKVVVVYGNCQAAFVAQILNHVPSFAERFQFIHVSNETLSGKEAATLPSAVDDAAILWEQHDEREDLAIRAEVRRRVPARCPVVTYPSMNVLSLWPFAWSDSRNEPEPGFPWGRYPWGDRIGQEVANTNGSAGDAFNKYMKLSMLKMPDVETLIARDRDLAERRDGACDVKMADFVFAHFKDEHLFWTWGHVSSLVTGELVRRLCERSKTRLGPLTPDFEFELNRVCELFPGIGEEQLPIHPEVARRLQLKFCRPDTKYSWFNKRWTFKEYMTRYISFDKSW
jgi:tetratricopeptide (TPR) repeat protein